MREIVTLWATRKSVDAGMHPPELLEAWDDYSIDENFEGWHESCKQAMAAMGDDLDQYRYITFRVDEDFLHDAFFVSTTAVVSARLSSETGR